MATSIVRAFHRRLACLAAVALWGALACHVSASIVMTEYASPAPNNTASPSWAAYYANALYAIENGLSSRGDPALPSYYREVTWLPRSSNLVSTFPSWLGVADPSAPYSGEYGNRLHFGLRILGNGTQFKLWNLSLTFDSNPDFLESSSSLSGYSYAPHRKGLDYGPDRVKGTIDDVIYTSDSGSTLVDELIYVGAGQAPAVSDLSPGSTRQEKIDNLLALVPPYLLTCTYMLWNDAHTSVVASSQYTVHLPEPASLTLLAPFAILVAVARRRCAHAARR